MPRRVHVTHLTPGPVALDPRSAHHLRDVLRLRPGDAVELFDDAGQTASARLTEVTPSRVTAEASDIAAPRAASLTWTIASAVPKGNRADWLVEKLSELGTACFIPLQTARSVVHPEGNKVDRWRRIAEESAKQSRRPGVMQISDLTPLSNILASATPDASYCLATGGTTTGIVDTLTAASAPPHALFFVGPEGDWSDDELARFDERHIRRLTLGQTILRVETAGLAVASIASALSRA